MNTLEVKSVEAILNGFFLVISHKATPIEGDRRTNQTRAGQA